jgi:hypothetical protein
MMHAACAEPSTLDETLDQDIAAFIDRSADQDSDDAAFTALALRLFRFQFERNIPYRRWCERRGQTPENVGSWDEIPAVPATVFKTVRLATFPEGEEVRVFKTSGTTNHNGPGKVYVDAPGLALTVSSMRRMGAAYIFPERTIRKAVALMPTVEVAPHMVLVLSAAEMTIGAGVSCDHVISAEGLDLDALVDHLRRAEAAAEPIALLGATFAFVHLFDRCRERGLSFRLPEGSLLMDGGGYKGRSRELTFDEFLAAAWQVLGTPPARVVNVLGLTEVQACYADNVIRNAVTGVRAPRFKLNPPWTRTVVVDADSLQPLPRGETGLLRHFNLANRSTVLAVQTEDLGREVDGGFEMLGRAARAEGRGCSLAMEEMLFTAKDGEEGP